MILLAHVLVFFHIVAATAWFGLALRLPAQARLILRMGGADARSISGEIRRAIRLMGGLLAAAFLLGLLAFFMLGGFDRYGANFHLSIVLVLLLLAAHYALIQPAWNRLADALRHDNTQDAVRHRRHMGLWISGSHLVWVVVLFLMLYDHYFRGFL